MNKKQLITKLEQDIKNAQAQLDNPRFEGEFFQRAEGIYRGIIVEARRTLRRLR